MQEATYKEKHPHPYAPVVSTSPTASGPASESKGDEDALASLASPALEDAPLPVWTDAKPVEESNLPFYNVVAVRSALLFCGK